MDVYRMSEDCRFVCSNPVVALDVQTVYVRCRRMRRIWVGVSRLIDAINRCK